MKLIKSRGRLTILLLFLMIPAMMEARILQQPQFHRPEFVLEYDTLSICIIRDPLPTNLTIQLKNSISDQVFPTSYIGPYFNQSGVDQYQAKLDGALPEGLYDVYIYEGSQMLDEARHSVRIYHTFPDTFYIAHISDTHLPSHRTYPSGYYDENTIEEIQILHQEFQWINPEFVIHTGDVIDWYMDESQYAMASEEFVNWKIPIIILPGNHDFYDILISGRKSWKKYFSSMDDYTAHFDQKLLVGLAAYEEVPNSTSITFTPTQIEFSEEVLSRNQPMNDRLFFFHYDFNNQIKDLYAQAWSIDHILYGHTHVEDSYRLGNTLWMSISNTSSSNLKYRLLKFVKDSLLAYPVIQGGHLSIRPILEQSETTHGYELINQNSCSFEHARIETVFPISLKSFSCSRGRIDQQYPIGNDSIGISVIIELRAQSTDTVYIYGTSTGIQESVDWKLSTIQVYPNPARDYLMIRTDSGLRINHISLYTITGHRVIKNFIGVLHQNMIKLAIPSGLPSGIFLLQMETEQGSMARKITILH